MTRRANNVIDELIQYINNNNLLLILNDFVEELKNIKVLEETEKEGEINPYWNKGPEIVEHDKFCLIGNELAKYVKEDDIQKDGYKKNLYNIYMNL